MEKKNGLKNCVCGKQPAIEKGRHNLHEKNVFMVLCKNPKCKSQPKTEDCLTIRGAMTQWENNVTTDSLFVQRNFNERTASK